MFLESEINTLESTEQALFHVIPAPLEHTVSYGSGTKDGPQAILDASNELERRCYGLGEPCVNGIYTHPAIDCNKPIRIVLDEIEQLTQSVVNNSGFPIIIGGEHSLTYGSVSGIMRALNQPVGIIQIDAHADLRSSYQGSKHSHACVMYLLCEAGVQLAQFGVRALCDEEMKNREKYNVYFRDAEELVINNSYSVELPDSFPELLYISFDVDGLDPSIMPATGTPVPGGLGYYQALALVQSALIGRRCIGFDVVELAPNGALAWDFTAASIVYRLMALVEGKTLFARGA